LINWKTILVGVIAGVIVQIVVHFLIKPIAEKKNPVSVVMARMDTR